MRRALTAVALALAVGTAAGLAVLWPGHTETRIAADVSVDTQKAEVVEVRESICPALGTQRCQLVTARLNSGPAPGRRVQLQLSALQGFDPDLDPGDEILVTKGARAAARPGADRGPGVLVLRLPARHSAGRARDRVRR